MNQPSCLRYLLRFYEISPRLLSVIPCRRLFLLPRLLACHLYINFAVQLAVTVVLLVP
ncbi:hypothetical protein K474DRAFT_1621345 [Panus rudis PR-1116 ss-1]|nr:hypothetical protein K474DRAFT_1621345 [Panus rudis PR-1116 ss-1]